MILPCLRGVVGDWVFYSTLMSASQISENVQSVKNIREASGLDDYLQRTLKGKRKAEIKRYLSKDGSRFFNSIIIGVFGGVPDWIPFKLDALVEREKEVRVEDVTTLNESMGIMMFSGEENLFAIDGQHRVEGIRLAHASKVKAIDDDQYSVLLIAHVDDTTGKKRTRKLFSDINKKAVPVSKGDRVVIDEEDITAIVARKVYADYPHFKEKNLISITESANLEDGDVVHFTNLLNLQAVSSIARRLGKVSGKTPTESNIEKLYKAVEEFFNWSILNYPEYREFFVESKFTLGQARRLNKYLLFRPAGINLLAKLYFSEYSSDTREAYLAKVTNLSFVAPESFLNRILWNEGLMEANSKAQRLAFDVALFKCGITTDDQVVAELLERFRAHMKNDIVDLPERLV